MADFSSIIEDEIMKPRLGLLILYCLVITLSPLYILRSQVGFIPTTLLEIMLLFAVSITLTDFFRTNSNIAIFKSKFNWLIVFFLLSAVIATLASVDFQGGLGILKAYFIEPILFFYCLIYFFNRYASKKKTINYLIYALVGCGIWLSILGLIQKFTGSYTLAPHELAQGRITAVYNSANSLALFLGPVSLLTLSLALKFTKFKKILFLGIFISFCLILILTKSKGGMIAEIVGLLVFLYALLSQKYHALRRLWGVVLAIIAISTLVFLTVSFSIFNQNPKVEFTPGDTLEIRFLIWQGTFNMLQEHPIFGAGLNGFKTLYSQNYKPHQYPEAFQYPHNILLTFWAECGIFGLIVFILLITKLFLILIKNLNSRDIFLGAGLIASFTYIMIHGSVDEPYFKNDLSLEFWVLVALVEMWRKI